MFEWRMREQEVAPLIAVAYSCTRNEARRGTRENREQGRMSYEGPNGGRKRQRRFLVPRPSCPSSLVFPRSLWSAIPGLSWFQVPAVRHSGQWRHSPVPRPPFNHPRPRPSSRSSPEATTLRSFLVLRALSGREEPARQRRNSSHGPRPWSTRYEVRGTRYEDRGPRTVRPPPFQLGLASPLVLSRPVSRPVTRARSSTCCTRAKRRFRSSGSTSSASTER